MRIWLKPDVMAQYKLIPNDVVAALSEQNIEAAPGQLGERGNQTYQYTLRYKGRLQQTTEFENIVIKALENGEILRLKDVANVELGLRIHGTKHDDTRYVCGIYPGGYRIYGLLLVGNDMLFRHGCCHHFCRQKDRPGIWKKMING